MPSFSYANWLDIWGKNLVCLLSLSNLSSQASVLQNFDYCHFVICLFFFRQLFWGIVYIQWTALVFFFNFVLDFRFWGTWAEHARQLRRNTHGSVLFFPSPLHPCLAFLPRLSLPTSPSHWPSPFPPNRPQCLVLPFLCPCVLIFHHPPMNENMWCFIFCSCVTLLRMMFYRFIHVPTNHTNSSFLMAA